MTIGKPPPLSILVLLTVPILILEEPETPKPQSKPEEKENKTVEDPEEELIEDDIDDEDVDDPDDEVIEIESNQVKKETPSTSRDQPQQTRQGTLFSLEFQSQNYKYFLVIEVDENDVPNEWRRVLYLDRQNMERLCDFDLSDGYTRGIPTSSKQI